MLAPQIAVGIARVRHSAGAPPSAISIHALREEGDLGNVAHSALQKIFLSTPSARRATGAPPFALSARTISIHALREEGDGRRADTPLHFLPFLSTPSARRATATVGFIATACRISIHALREEGDLILQNLRFDINISIHALREEGDLMITGFPTWFLNFYPRPPRGGRRAGAGGRS